MPIPIDKELYEKAKQIADETYKKSSAYKSGFIVKKYKELGGRYKDNGEEKSLKNWFNEAWKDIANREYPVYRPTKRINKNTPLTIDEIDEDNLKQQIELKQKIKGDENLPPFKPKYINIKDVPKNHEIYKYSNPYKLRKIADTKGFKNDEIYLSDKPNKKYMLFHPKTNKKIYFGESQFEDYLYHNDEVRRMKFKNRNKKWADFDKYTPAYMSYFLVW
jgi:hypothetical protein